jgi:hypothetical protein
MIKVGIIRTRSVIIPFLSFALGAPPLQQDRYLARRPISAFSRAWPATAGPSNLRRTSAFATTDSVRSQIWGHASDIPSLLRPIQNSGWSCFRYRSGSCTLEGFLASFHTRCTLAPFAFTGCQGLIRSTARDSQSAGQAGEGGRLLTFLVVLWSRSMAESTLTHQRARAIALGYAACPGLACRRRRPSRLGCVGC